MHKAEIMQKFILMSNFLNSEKYEETIHLCDNSMWETPGMV